jgi:Domain of unknown function (DUF5666)
MKTRSVVRRSRPVSCIALFLNLASLAFLAGCGGGPGTPPPGTPIPGQTSSVTLLLSSTANDQLSSFSIGIQSINLTNKAGQSVNVFTASDEGAEFIHLNGTPQPFATLSVPQDIYTAATAMLGGAQFTTVGVDSSDGISTATYAYGYVPQQFVTVNLPAPVTVSGATMALTLDLQGPQSYTVDPNAPLGSTYTITPTFDFAPFTVASQPTNAFNGKQTGIDGQISSLNTAGNGFTVATGDFHTVSVNTNAGTLYQGVPEFSSLTVGTFVDFDVLVQSDGSLTATRVAVLDPLALDVVIGPLLYVDKFVPAIYIWGREQQGLDFAHAQFIGGLPYSFGSATFQISPQFTNLQDLPFPATFTSTNLTAGQNLYLTSPEMSQSGGYPYTSVTTLTLMPQTINGTISGVSTDGAYQLYTVQLAPDDPIVLLPAAQGSASNLLNPSTVVVYTNSDTQLLTSSSFAVGSVLRFYGLLFNDNGALRMDCIQVTDGVAE